MSNDLLELQNWAAFGASLGIGLLIGLERERSPAAKAGVRTFALVSLCGTLAALIDQALHTSSLIPLGLALVATMLIASYMRDRGAPDPDPGTTTVAAAAVTYLLGVLVGIGQAPAAGALAIGVTALLYFKPEIERFSVALPRQDMVSALQFLVITFIILPIVPDRAIGPYAVLNPRQIWMMVVLISGMGMASYMVTRIWGQRRHSLALTGVLGGLVSSTATTVLYAKRAGDSAAATRHSLVVVLFANLVPLVRVSVLTAVVAPVLLPLLAPVLGCALLCGLLVTSWSMRKIDVEGQLPVPNTRNPTELPMALSFGLVYGGVLLAGAALADWAGTGGLFLTAAASGLMDVDAVTLSSFNLFSIERIGQSAAVIAVAIAFAANMTFKLGVLAWYGGTRMALHAVGPLFAVALGGALGLYFFLPAAP